MWVGTDKGLALLDIRGAKTRVLSSVSTRPVRDILIDGDSVLVATWGQGLLRVGPGGVQTVYAAASPKANRLTAVQRHQGELWWATAGAGLWHKKGNGLAEHSSRVPKNSVLWALRSAGDQLWIGGEAGAMQLGAPQVTSHAVRSLDIVNGQMQAASFGQGLQQLEGKNTSEYPGDRFARSIRERNGVACMGTQEALWIRRDTSWQRAEMAAGLPANDIAAFVTIGEHGYVGTFDQGVARIDDGKVSALAIEIDPHVNALAIDRKTGALWIGTSSGLARFHQGALTRFTKATGLPSNHVMSLAALAAGGVLVGTAAGAGRVQEGVAHPVGGKGQLLTGNVWAVAEGDDGTEWLGTTRGVFRLRGSQVDRYRVASGELPDDWVMALAVADDGVFVGTYKAGVVRLVTTGTRVVAKRLGEGWINPSGLHWDGQVLRAATMHGAFRGDGTSPDWQSKRFGPGQDTTAYLPAGDDSEWIVTRRGLVRRAYASESK